MWDHHVPINNVSRYTQSCHWVFTVLTSFFFCAPTILEVGVAILASVFVENVRKLNDENLTVVFNTTIMVFSCSIRSSKIPVVLLQSGPRCLDSERTAQCWR